MLIDTHATPLAHDVGIEDVPTFSATIDKTGKAVLVGELDLTTLDALRTILDQVLLDAGEIIAIDASRVTFIDSTAISELLRYGLLASSDQRCLWLDPVSPQVARTLEILDLRHILLAPAARSAS